MSDLVVGVIGGMGPAATADFLAKLTRATAVLREQDHLRVLVDSNPGVPDRNRAIAGTGESPAPALADMARGLERAGADFLVIACNTAHAFEDAVREAVSIPLVGMIDETCDACERLVAPGARVGYLAAQGCLDAGLYRRAFERRGRDAITLSVDEQARFMDLLYRIKRGELTSAVRDAMRGLAESLVARDAALVVAACTEVPLAVASGECSRPLVDATAHLAERCVVYARRLEPLPSPPS